MCWRARIRGDVKTLEKEKAADKPKDEPQDADDEKPADDAGINDAKDDAKVVPINVVLVADVDLLSPAFFEIREKGDMPELGINFEFDNVTFVLNVLDELADNADFLDVRKRRRIHRTLTRIQDRTEAARKASTEAIENTREEFDEASREAESKLTEKIQELQKDMAAKHVDLQEIVRRIGIAQREEQKRMDAVIEQKKLKRDKEILRIDTDLSNEIEEVQNSYRMWAVLLPPIPPLLLACFVFFVRRAKEREGVAQTRLRK